MTNHNLAFKALADPSRRHIVEALAGQPMTVRQLTDRLPISQSAVSQHLDVLRKAKLVAFEPRGASNVYRIDPRGLGSVRGWLDRHWGEALGNYARLFEHDGDASNGA
jgi:DNA-binding transcriptional ArsR family regulator